MTLHGCTEITGGAVELSWHLENTDGSPFGGCPTTIDQIRLSWQVNGVTASDDFQCEANHGVTAFVVPAGDALLSVAPVCANGVPAQTAGFIAPAPIERTITVDNVVELHAVVLQIDELAVCSLPGSP